MFRGVRSVAFGVTKVHESGCKFMPNYDSQNVDGNIFMQIPY